MPAWIESTLRERIDVHSSLAIFRAGPDEGPVPAFEPGQFTRLGLRRSAPGAQESVLDRAFSIASTPRERDHFEFYVRRVEQGEFTPLLFELRPGARLLLDARVYGRFTLAEVPPESDLLMVATGTGLAPYLSMLRTHRGERRWRRCVLLESARTAFDLGYRLELERLAREDASFSYRPSLTREPATSAWRGLRGHVQSWLEPNAFRRIAGAPLDAGWQVLLCGNPDMIVSATEILAGQGLRPHRRRAPGQIHSERYW